MKLFAPLARRRRWPETAAEDTVKSSLSAASIKRATLLAVMLSTVVEAPCWLAMATVVSMKPIPVAESVPLVERNPVPACERVSVSTTLVPVDQMPPAISVNVPEEKLREPELRKTS